MTIVELEDGYYINCDQIQTATYSAERMTAGEGQVQASLKIKFVGEKEEQEFTDNYATRIYRILKSQAVGKESK